MIVAEVLCQPWRGFPRATHLLGVEEDGTIRIYEPEVGRFTIRHSFGPKMCRALARKIRAAAAEESERATG